MITIEKVKNDIRTWRWGSHPKKLLAKIKNFLFGTNMEEKGFLSKAVLYFLLFDLALLYLGPVIYMISTMLKSFPDLIDPTTKWVPKEINWNNLYYAYEQLNIKIVIKSGRALWDNLRSSALFNSVSITFPSAIVQVISCSIAGYAFGRMKFPGKKILFILLILTYIIPPQTVIMPMTWMYRKLNLLNNPLSFIGPALFGHGLKGGLFVIIYMQFFKKLPKELEEAATIDGASILRLFWKIMFPLAKPAIIVVFLFSMVWHWNETYMVKIFYSKFQTLSTRITGINPPVEMLDLSLQPVKMACGFLVILPILLIYLGTQRWFTESIERTGLVE